MRTTLPIPRAPRYTGAALAAVVLLTIVLAFASIAFAAWIVMLVLGAFGVSVGYGLAFLGTWGASVVLNLLR